MSSPEIQVRPARARFGHAGQCLFGVLMLAYSSLAPAGELARCGIGMETDESTGQITRLTIKLSDLELIKAVPVGDLKRQAEWTTELLKYAENARPEDSGVEIVIEDAALFYGGEFDIDHALIKARGGYSWKHSCGRQVDQPNNGSVQFRLDPEVLEGSYSAILINCDGRQVVPMGSVSGTFSCIGPVDHDPRYETRVSEPEQLRVAAFTVWTTMKHGAEGQLPVGQPDTARPPSMSPGSPEAAGSELPECDCSCAAVAAHPAGDACTAYCATANTGTNCGTTEEAAGSGEIPPECAELERLYKGLAGEEASAEETAMAASIFGGIGKNCAELSPEERQMMLRQASQLLGGGD